MTAPAPEDRLVWTPQQLGEALQVSVKVIYEEIKAKRIRANQIGRALRVPRAEARRLLGIED
jgi:excisionase family DNA binding protein